jgi:tryptophan 2,3-dioxygenase
VFDYDNPITRWLDDPDLSAFPYDLVVGEYLRVGKHFVADDLLKGLSLVRDRLYDLNWDRTPEWTMLSRFLGTALDKYDGRYDYPTYTALEVLGLPDAVVVPGPAGSPLVSRDRLLVGLAADTLRFELAALDGRTDLLPQQRPDPRTVAKRCRLTLHATTPALARLGLAGGVTSAEPVTAARQLSSVVGGTWSQWERRVLRLSMLPVYVCHDEYLFIRVLQMFETTFAMLAGQLRGAVRGMAERADWTGAVRGLELSALALRESAPLFSLLATMQVESFRTFRAYTEGASAIQSRSYKQVESLCARPDPARLDSAAYLSVPEVRSRVLAGQLTLDEAFTVARTAGRVPPAGIEALTGAMAEFADALLRWRQTHYRLAVRMLGERPGTGYTEGTPYLKAVRRIPVFRTIVDAKEVGEGE